MKIGLSICVCGVNFIYKHTLNCTFFITNTLTFAFFYYKHGVIKNEIHDVEIISNYKILISRRFFIIIILILEVDVNLGLY